MGRQAIMILALLIMGTGGVGAVLRHLLDSAVSRRYGAEIPWGIIVVNVIGSFAAGILLGATTYEVISPTTAAVILVGLLGGFTTASTLAYDTARLVTDRRLLAALGVQGGTLILALAAGIVGLILGAPLGS